MHGVIFCELKSYVEKTLGLPMWMRITKEANLPAKQYSGFRCYPDEELMNLIGTASRISEIPVPALVESFGKYLGPILVQARIHLYFSGIHSCPVAKPEWDLFDVISNTENMIHTIVHVALPGSEPAILDTKRNGQNEVKIIYTSKRKLCWLARGIIQGISSHYKTPVEITEPKCMHRGDATCELIVRKASDA